MESKDALRMDDPGDFNFLLHQLKNYLTVMQSNAELLRFRSGGCEELDQILIFCEKSMETIKSLRQTKG